MSLFKRHDAVFPVSWHLLICNLFFCRFALDKGCDLRVVAEKCPKNLTGADFYALCSDAMLNALKRKIALLDTGL